MDRLFDYGVPFEVLVKGRWPDATFDIFDVNSLITDIHDNPSAYLDAPANVTGWYHNCNTDGSVCVNEANPLDTFLWYDTLHPSERTGESTPHPSCLQIGPFPADNGFSRQMKLLRGSSSGWSQETHPMGLTMMVDNGSNNLGAHLAIAPPRHRTVVKCLPCSVHTRAQPIYMRCACNIEAV